MAKTYVKEDMKIIVEDCKKLQSQTNELYNDVIYNADMWSMKQKLKGVIDSIKFLEKTYKEMSPKGF